MTVPDWMWGGDSAGFFAAAELHRHRVPEAADRWRVKTEERYRRITLTLITVDHLDGPAALRPRLQLLAEMAAAPPLHDEGEQLNEELLRIVADDERANWLVDNLTRAWVQTATAPPERLPELTASVLQALRSVSTAEQPGFRPFSHAGVHLVRRAEEVLHRAKFATVLLQLDHDHRLSDGFDAAQRLRHAPGDQLWFDSSQGLFDGVFTLDAYLGPLLGALSPYIWAFTAHRAFVGLENSVR
jgi:hypothetical protein